ncbi:unnamed protein product, partial [Adineta ricciae]
MKTTNSIKQPSVPFRARLAGVSLIIACGLFIFSNVYVRWSTFPFNYRNFNSVYSGLWRRNVIYGTRVVSFKIKCSMERKSCVNLIIARIFMVLACITSGMGGICLSYLPSSKAKQRSLVYIIGLILAFLSFGYGLVGFLSGIIWIAQFERDAIGSAAICALIGSLLSLTSAICA